MIQENSFIVGLTKNCFIILLEPFVDIKILVNKFNNLFLSICMIELLID